MQEFSVSTQDFVLLPLEDLSEGLYGYYGARSSVVAEALCYKPEGREFVIQCGELNFSIYQILSASLGNV
jgi:hypothetical protein